MERHLNRALLGLLACAICLPAVAGGQDPAPPEEAEPEIIREEPIDSGYVILNGRYLPPPYTLEKRGDDLWVNDQLAISDWFGRSTGDRGRGEPRRGGRGGRNGGPMRGGPGERSGPGERGGPGERWPPGDSQPLLRLVNTLKYDGTIIGGESLRGSSLPEVEAISVFVALTSEMSDEEKVNQIRSDWPHRLDEPTCQRLVETFVPCDELMERMGPEIELAREMVQKNEAQHKAALASIFWTSQPVKYVVTLMAMGLVVAACGTLLNYRPMPRGRWSELDAAGEGVPIVVRSVVLLVLLGIFDLGCTLVAQQAGGFTEMNPLGSRIVENPLLLITFKLTTLLLACTILFVLRRYRGAQVASWWMCLLCTVLTFRWITYNSMFMS